MNASEVLTLHVAAEAVAEAVDAFRERLVNADAPDDWIEEWQDAAHRVWDAASYLDPEGVNNDTPAVTRPGPDSDHSGSDARVSSQDTKTR